MANTPTGPTQDPEKLPTTTFSTAHTDSTHSNPSHDGTITPTHPHQHYGSRARANIRSFFHPSGKRIHVATDPIEAESLRRRLQAQIPTDPAEEFDILISGTPEHLEAVRHAQTHHEGRRHELSKRHAEIWTQFADVQGELDALSGELGRITEHGVKLDAHFDRFGYSAHIKSYDDASPNESGTTTPRRSSETTSLSGKEGEVYATPLKFFKVPVVRQYFHKGILWRASGYEEVQSFELFVDLLYVGIIAVNGDAASEQPTWLSLLQFVITFTLSWKIWNDMAMIIAWFETDDIFQRLSVLFLLACLFGYTTNIVSGFEHTYSSLIWFYLTARLYMCGYLVLCAWLIPMIRYVMIYQIALTFISSAIWIGSIYVEWPNQLALIWIALTLDILFQGMYFLFAIWLEQAGGKWQAWAEANLAFMPALNIEHRVERTSAFVTLVFGYTVVAMLYQTTTPSLDAFFGKAILGLIQAFAFNWLYFEIDASNISLHAIRRHKWSAMIWTLSHLPFIMSFVLGGGALARLVLATDTEDAHVEMLTETYQHRSDEHVASGIRWFYSAGFGVALLCMTLISLSHIHKSPTNIRFPKKKRLAYRIAVAIILILLPLAESLNSLELVGTVTALVLFLLFCELWACSCAGAKLVGRDKQCKYMGACRKKDLMKLVRDGGGVEVLGKLSREKGGGLGVAPM
nr:hypothetical protein B0A51_07432 [Rachicladosporium sp. CCFEE 5018]